MEQEKRVTVDSAVALTKKCVLVLIHTISKAKPLLKCFRTHVLFNCPDSWWLCEKAINIYNHKNTFRQPKQNQWHIILVYYS